MSNTSNIAASDATTASNDDQDLFFDWVSTDDLEAAHTLEVQGFPAEEAASLNTFRYRQSQAPDLFLGAYLPPRILVGYVCSTLSPTNTLTHESMSNHVPLSTSVCIHSICVDSARRGKRIGSRLLAEYVKRLEARGTYERLLLISHAELRRFYELAGGFEWLGKSTVVHGPREWYEMRRIVKSQILPVPPTETGGTIPPGLLEALQRPSGKNQPSPRLIAAFPNGIEDVILASPSSPNSTNKYDLICPRPNCGSVILKSGVAAFAKRPSVQLEPADFPVNPQLLPLPAPPAQCSWWLVTPSPMAFENIGFSRAVSQDATSAPIKLLSCAECELGPLGWCEIGGKEFWLACNRVAYRG